MRDFERTGARLRSLSFHARLVYSIFVLFTIAGLVVTVVLYEAMVGLGGGRVAVYYAGTADARVGDAPGGGPRTDVPPDFDRPDAEPMPMRRLLETTHFHLFSVPVFLLILSHLFMLTSLSSRARTFWVLGASVATAAHLAAPWIARAGLGGSRFLYGSSGAALAVTFGVLSLVPLWEMWRPLRPSNGVGA